jgi:hypothetical protein
MLKTMFATAVFLFSFNVFAVTPFEVLQQSQLKNIQHARFDWITGDSCNYNVDMGFIKGTMVMSVGNFEADGSMWMIQDMDLGFMGKQKMEMLMDPTNGQIKKLLVNGQEQQVPEAPDLDIISVTDETITVPAGTFDTQHAQLKDKKTNDEMNMWATLDVPVSGMAKQIQPSQLGQVTMVLTGFHKQTP